MEPFVYLESYRVPVCRICRFACVSDEVPTHLRTRHKDMTPAERHKVARDIARIPGIIKDQLRLEGFQFPPPTISKVPFLIPPEPDGLKCRKCPYIAKQEKKIHRHSHSCQGWQNPRSRGRPKKGDIDLAPERPWIEHVPCQRFFLSRAASGWFEVGRKLAACKGTPAGTTAHSQCGKSAAVAPETRAHLQEVLEREQKYLDAEKQPRVYSKALGDDSFAGTSIWLERTQWPVTYKGVRRDILQAMTRLRISVGIDSNINTDFVLGQGLREGDADIVSLKKEEQKISRLLGAVDLMLGRCEVTVQHTSRLLRCWLVSSKPGNYQPKPFALWLKRILERNTEPYSNDCCEHYDVSSSGDLRLLLEARITIIVNDHNSHQATACCL